MTRAEHATRRSADADRADTPNDAELVRRLAGGDLASVGVLYDRYHDAVRQFVARASAGDADVEDITHETFLTLASLAARYDGRECARPFLLGIAAKLVRRRKSGIKRLTRLLASAVAELTPSGRSNPEDETTAREKLSRVEEALARLTEEKRLVLLLVEREGLSGEEVARALEIPVNTVWTRLHYARNELRRALLEEAS